INWGWGGSANGYFASDALNPVVSKAHSYNNLMTVVYNIFPAASLDLEWSPVHITSDERQVGLTLDTDDITSVGSFTVRAGALKNISNTDFSGKLAVALFGADGKQKCLLSDPRNFKLIAMQISKYADYTCKLPAGTSVAAGDVVRMVTQAYDGAAWLPVAGDNRLSPGEVPAKGGMMSYYDIIFPGSAEYVEIEAGNGKVIKGRDYSFKVVPTAIDKVVTVKANGFILTPDANNVYKLTNVLADQRIDVNVQNAADVLSKSILWVEAGKLHTLLNDNETSTVKDLTLFGTINAEDFAFIRERLKLERLDISQVSILASGSNPANAIPTKGLMGCRSLQTLILPNNLSTFKNGCLAQTGLRSIDIPASVGTFEYNVFVGCGALREVISRRSAPAWVNWCVFSGVPQDKLIVPVGSTAAYQAKEYWQDFKEIVEGLPEAPTTFSLTVAEKKGLNFMPVTEGTQFNKGDQYAFRVETDNSFDDAVMQVYSNSSRLTADAEGIYRTTINGNTLIHVEFREPQATTADKTWKLTGDVGGIGLVSEVVNVPVGKMFTVRANAIKVPKGDDAAKFYGIVLTDKNGGIKEFISSIISNYYSRTGENLTYNFNCQVKEAQVKEGNKIRLATSYNKKDWQLVEAEADSISDRLEAVGNPVIYHNVVMPSNVTGARIDGGATQVARGMPFSVKVSAINPAQRVTVSINGETKASNVAVANVSVPAVVSDLDVTITVKDADAGDYMVFNIQEGLLASKLVDCPQRVKLIGTMLVSDFDALRANASVIIDLDMADVTIKGAAMTGNSIPENAFAPTTAGALSALRTVILPNNLERINKNAFARCTQISELTIPANVSYIGDGAFSACVGLKKIIAKPKVAPACGNMSPFPQNPSAITLEVPKGSEESYTVPSIWWAKLSLYKAPTEQKDYYWVKVDKSRVGVVNYKGDLNSIGVGSDDVEFILELPNCQYSSLKAEYKTYQRPGVPFKLYDNGVDVFANLSRYQYTKGNVYLYPNQTWSMAAGKLGIRFLHSSTSGPWMPQNHEIEIAFYYGINFQNLAGADGVEAQIVEVPDGCEWRNVPMVNYKYMNGNSVNSEIKPVLYKEGSDIKFQLSDPGPKTALVVNLVTKVMTKGGPNPVYEERTVELEADNGIYTIPDLQGDCWVKITGVTSYEEGDPIPADDLSSLKKENVAAFSELTVTGEMNEEDFETLRDKFEAVETLDLTQLANEVIPENAFAGMESLRTVMIPETVTEIGEGAFQGCENIETLTLPGVNAIGEGAFEGCTNLKSILIPSSDTATEPTVAEAPVKRIRRVGARNGNGITAESFRGLNPNCLIYIGANEIPDSEALNIILNRDGSRVAASDIILDGNNAFNAPASFNLGDHSISFTVDIPGSLGADDNDGWKGIMLPFTPTSMEYGVEFAERPGSGITIISFEDENAETMTRQTAIEANRPYMANVSAPYAAVPVTFYAKGSDKKDDSVFDVPYTPVPEENVAVGKNFSLYGSFDGETVIGTVYGLDDTADSFVRPADGEKVAVRPFDAYLCANAGVDEAEYFIGEHPLWIFEPAAESNVGSKLYRSDKVTISSLTTQADIYYTLDGTDPTVADGSRKLYEAPFDLEGELMDLRAVAEYKGQLSDVVPLTFELRKVDINYNLAKNWNWISHHMETPVAVSDFADSDITRILSHTEETVNDPLYGLTGTLKTLDPTVTYKVHVASEGWNGNIAGVAFDPKGTVALHKGWNWIGSPIEDASHLVTDLLSGLTAEEGDMIVGLEGFTQADAEGNWHGSLERLVPGTGYMYFSNSDKEFTFARLTEADEAAVSYAPVETPWAVDIHRYSSVMPVTASLIDATASDYLIGAFCGDECRGIGVNVNGTVMMNVHGELGDLISFRLISGDTERRTRDNLAFGQNPVGTFAAPYELNVSGTVAVEEVNGSKDYVVIGENGEIVVTGDLSRVLSVEVFDLDGHKVADASKVSDGSLKIGELEPGVRIIVVRTVDGSHYRKLMVK
ncbi:MAG: leucine-rich repeat protein, partial [Muribaculaceae bacterium]|nr:leucine-rich repeat protein [Muribaculaceae bacterium]